MRLLELTSWPALRCEPSVELEKAPTMGQPPEALPEAALEPSGEPPASGCSRLYLALVEACRWPLWCGW